MGTRREILTLLALTPLMTSVAVGQSISKPEDLFKRASMFLKDPNRVRTRYRSLSYYIQLLFQFPPKSDQFNRDKDFSDAVKTYSILGTLIEKSEAKFDEEAAKKSIPILVDEYAKLQTPLWDYMKDVGIQLASPADIVLEEAIASMMLFFAAANKVTEIKQMKWCIFPFCFGRPG